MAWYTLECPECGVVDEYQFEAILDDKQDDCVECGHRLYTTKNRLYSIDKPRIEGETCSGSCSYEGYDEGMGEYVSGKQHRAELMKKKGLEPFSPDPAMKKHRDEARYIRKDGKGDKAGIEAAVRSVYKTATDERRNKLMNKSFDKSFKKLDAQ